MTVFGRHPERTLDDLAGEALHGALKDAGCATAISARVLLGHDQRPAAGTDLRFPGRSCSARSASRAFRSSTSRMPAPRAARPFNLAVQSLKAGSSRRRAGARRREDEHPRQGKAMAIFEARLGRVARRGELPDAGEDGRGRRAAAGLGIGQAVQPVHVDLRRHMPLSHDDLRHDAAPDRRRVRPRTTSIRCTTPSRNSASRSRSTRCWRRHRSPIRSHCRCARLCRTVPPRQSSAPRRG